MQGNEEDDTEREVNNEPSVSNAQSIGGPDPSAGLSTPLFDSICRIPPLTAPPRATTSLAGTLNNASSTLEKDLSAIDIDHSAGLQLSSPIELGLLHDANSANPHPFTNIVNGFCATLDHIFINSHIFNVRGTKIC